MVLNEIIKTQKEIIQLGHSIENNVLESIDINVIAHFGNTVCLELLCSNVGIMNSYNNTVNIGYLIRALIELLALEEEDGKRISDIKRIPVRLIFEGNGGWGSRCIGFGHFMKDKFVLTEDFTKIDGNKLII